MKYFLIILITVFGISCSHIAKTPEAESQAAPNFLVQNLESLSAASENAEDCNSKSDRDLASEKCISAFLQGETLPAPARFGESYLSRNLKKDPVVDFEARKKSQEEIDNTVSLTDKMKKFRKEYLRFFAPGYGGREALVRSFEATLRFKSLFVANRLKQEESTHYDLVIVGAGIHGIIALHQALRQNPNAKILLVDENDTAGSVFRYARESFNINSSNRSSGPGSVPLPGRGNLNELPGLPIQVSDLTGVKYPTANDLGSPVLASLYAAVKEHPNVDIMFNTSFDKAYPRMAGSTGTSAELTFLQQDGFLNTIKTRIQVSQKKLIVTSGLGKPTLPKELINVIARNPSLLKPEKKGVLPKIITFEDYERMLGQSNDPISLYAGKRFAVVGPGDSGNVTIEGPLGLISQDGYAGSSAQSGRAKKIFWIGQSLQTCKQYIDDARSRYAAIGKGFDTSDAEISAILEARPQRLADVQIAKDGKVSAMDSAGRVIADKLDFIVVATGYEQSLSRVFRDLDESIKDKAPKTDVELFESNSFKTLSGITSVSEGKETVLGRKHESLDVYVFGTAADLTIPKSELKGVLQNKVSIFNNAPRVVSGVLKALNNFTPLDIRAPEFQRITLAESSGNQTILVSGIEETRRLPAQQNLQYLKSIVQESFLYVRTKKNVSISFDLQTDSFGRLIVVSRSEVDLVRLTELLAETRDFFALAAELIAGSGKKLRVSVPVNSGIPRASAVDMILMKDDISPLPSPSAVIANRRINLRGQNLLANLQSQKNLRLNINRADDAQLPFRNIEDETPPQYRRLFPLRVTIGKVPDVQGLNKFVEFEFPRTNFIRVYKLANSESPGDGNPLVYLPNNTKVKEFKFLNENKRLQLREDDGTIYETTAASSYSRFIKVETPRSEIDRVAFTALTKPESNFFSDLGFYPRDNVLILLPEENRIQVNSREGRFLRDLELNGQTILGVRRYGNKLQIQISTNQVFEVVMLGDNNNTLQLIEVVNFSADKLMTK